MLTEDAAAVGQALRVLPAGERRAVGREAAALARRLEFLTWTDRATILDELYWQEARARLRHELITAIVNRRAAPDPRSAKEVEQFATYCRALTTATLLTLADPLTRIQSAAAAWSHRLSLLDGHQQAAAAWLDVDDGHREQAAHHLARCPGHAFVLLSLCPNDSAESFAARDAFFAAMLGRA